MILLSVLFFVLLDVRAFQRDVFDDTTTRIVNGTNAKEKEFPFAVSLRYGNYHFCGGSILNENFVLTAAHCVCERNLITEHLSVQYGVIEITNDSFSSIPVKKIICHKYDPSIPYLIYDVALLELNTTIPRSSFEPVTIASSGFSTKNTLGGTVIGWGLNYTDGFRQDHLQKVDVIVYDDQTCRKSFAGYLNLEHHLCAGWPENGKGSCQGDSGGPLVVNDIQVGIVSFGASGNCGISNTTLPKVLARVSSYANWIKKNAGDVRTSSVGNNLKIPHLLFSTLVASFVLFIKYSTN